MKRLTKWDILLFVLSIYVVIELFVSSIITYPQNLSKVLQIVDTMICVLFLVDFFYGLIISQRKIKYLKTNWIDFVSSIPMVGVLRIGRIVRIIRVLRLMRSGRVFYNLFSRKNSVATLKNLLLLVVFLIIIFTISIHQLEKEINPFFNSIGNSFWWTLHTTMTFGFFQDISPISIEGKFISIVLILMGMILFGTLISSITDYFIHEEDIAVEIKRLQQMVKELNEKIDRLDSKIKGN